jgi:YihY family inner membrane protein
VTPAWQQRLTQVGLPQLWEKVRRAGTSLLGAKTLFMKVDGLDWAAAFSFNAFFSLFPLMVLLVTIASVFVDPVRAAQGAIVYLGDSVPLDGQMRRHVFEVIEEVLEGRAKASVVAVVMLVWTALQCFSTLVSVTNAAWGHKANRWWRLPLKSLTVMMLMAVTALLAIGLPPVVKMAQDFLFPDSAFRSWSYHVMIAGLAPLISFASLTLFYRFAPHRHPTWRNVWFPALFATTLLQLAQWLFGVYLERFATLDAIYGAFGSVMALLLWIYISGCIFIFGACLGAAQAAPTEAPLRQKKRRGR